MPNKIVYLKDKLPQGFIGMNARANKKFKVVKNHPKNTFYIYDDGNKDRVNRTILHEELEEDLMRRKGLSYKKSHAISNLIEDNPDLIVRVRGDNHKRGSNRVIHRQI